MNECTVCGGIADENGCHDAECVASREWQSRYFERLVERRSKAYPVPEHYAGARLDPAADPVHAAIAEWVAASMAGTSSGGIVLRGANGSGKTWLAAATLRAWRDAGGGWTLFAPCAELLADLRATFGQRDGDGWTESELIDHFAEAPLVVLDDLGDHGGSEWAWGELRDLINRRYNANLRTIVTTNLGSEDFGRTPHLRALGSRIVDGAFVVRMDGTRRSPARSMAAVAQNRAFPAVSGAKPTPGRG